MNIYTVDFEGIYPVGNCLLVRAENKEDAYKLAQLTIKHTSAFTVDDIEQIHLTDEPQVLEYLSGDY